MTNISNISRTCPVCIILASINSSCVGALVNVSPRNDRLTSVSVGRNEVFGSGTSRTVLKRVCTRSGGCSMNSDVGVGNRRFRIINVCRANSRGVTKKMFASVSGINRLVSSRSSVSGVCIGIRGNMSTRAVTSEVSSGCNRGVAAIASIVRVARVTSVLGVLRTSA